MNETESIHKIREHVWQIQNWLHEYMDPHHKIIITDTTFELLSGLIGETSGNKDD